MMALQPRMAEAGRNIVTICNRKHQNYYTDKLYNENNNLPTAQQARGIHIWLNNITVSKQ